MLVFWHFSIERCVCEEHEWQHEALRLRRTKHCHGANSDLVLATVLNYN